MGIAQTGAVYKGAYMRKIPLVSCCLLLVCTGAILAVSARTTHGQPHPEAANGQATPAMIPSASGLLLSRLANGLTVAIMPDSRFPLVATRLYVRAGSAYEKPELAGISHQLEHMVFKGTKNKSGGEIAAAVEQAGGYLNAATSFDYTVYLTDMPSAHWVLGMEVLKEMAFEPRLDKDDVEAEKKVVLAEQQRDEDSPRNRLFTRMQAQALSKTPYERPIIGYPDTVRSLTSEDLRSYIADLYQPQSMLLLVVGDVDPAKVLAEATRQFSAFSNTKAVTPATSIPPAAFSPAGAKVLVEKGPWDKVRLFLSFPAFDSSDSRSVSLAVLAELLGGNETSYLHRTYKYDKQLVDEIAAYNLDLERLGLFAVSAVLSPDKLLPFWKAFTADLSNFGNLTFSPQELARVTVNVEDAVHRQKETISGLASKLGRQLFFHGSESAEQNYLNIVRGTTMHTLAPLMQELFSPDRLTVTMLVPEDPGKNAAPAPPGQIPGNVTATPEPVPDPMPDQTWVETTLHAAWPSSKAAGNAGAASVAGGSRETIDLGKGRTLILLPDATLPNASVDMVFAGGNALLAVDQQGLGALTASMLTKGTAAMHMAAIEEFLLDRAAALGASSGKQTFTISMRYPSRFAKDMLFMLQEILTTATLPEEEVVRAKANQKAAIITQEELPMGLAMRRLTPFLFKNHPYGYIDSGTLESVQSFSRADIQAFWEKQFRQPWVMAISGAFDRESVIQAAKKLPVPVDSAVKVGAPVWNAEKTLHVSLKKRNQAHLLMAFPTVAASHPDAPGLDLLRTIMAGQSGLLFEELRNKQSLGYAVTAFMQQNIQSGVFMLYIGTEPDKLEIARKGFTGILADLCTKLLPESEITRGKNQMQSMYIRNSQKLSSRSNEAATLALLGFPATFNQDNIARAQHLTAADLQKLAQQYLRADQAYIATVQP